MEMRNNRRITRLLLILSLLSMVGAIGLFVSPHLLLAGYPLVGGLILLSLFTNGHPRYHGHTFTAWVFTFLAAAMFLPHWFTGWGHDPETGSWTFNTKILVLPLLQLIMFRIGTSQLLASTFN